MAFDSPYEGQVPVDDVLRLTDRCVALAPGDLYVADTVGHASPERVAELCTAIRERWPDLRLSVHLHGPDARGLACAVAAVRAGATQVETSICGLGGPVVQSPGSDAVGNLATEALVSTFAELGLDTGLEPDAVAGAARAIAALLTLPAKTTGHVPPAAEVAQLAGVRS